MSGIPCPQRTFPLKLVSWLPARYVSYLRWLRHLVERLGPGHVLALWQEVFETYHDDLLRGILTTGWNEVAQDEAIDVEAAIAALPARFFPVARAGIGKEKARQLVEQMPPISQIRRSFASFNVWRETTAYEAIHLGRDGLARLAEAVIRSFGKQGELIVYDVLREERVAAAGGKTGSVAEFIADFVREPESASLFTAGLDSEILRVSTQEVVLHVRACEWARYFQERHPQVGYLMACSTDEAAYRAFNDNLRLQRTSTLMEGGRMCDFRIYAVGAAPDYE